MQKYDFDKMSDEEILSLVPDKDSGAVDYIFDKYRNFVRAKARTYFLIGADREDIIQEGMIGLYKAVRDYKPGSGATFRSFAGLCITRQIISAIKTATRQKHIPLNSYISLSKSSFGDDSDSTLLDLLAEQHKFDPEEIMINRERSDFLENRLIASLSKYETCVLRKYLAGKRYCVIAAELGKSEKSIDNALQRIKKKIEKIASESDGIL